MDELPPEPAPRFSPVVTGLAVVVLLVSVGLLGWLMYGTPHLGDVATAEQALPQIVSRTMDLRSAVAQAPRWERGFYELMAGDAGRDLEEAIGWYRELARESDAAAVQAQLLVLEGEAGRFDRLRRHPAGWPELDQLRPIIRRAYLDEAETVDDDAVFRPEQVATLLDGWFYDRLAIRWGTRTGAAELVMAAQADLTDRTRPLLGRVRALVGLEIAVLALGLLALAIGLVHRRRERTAFRVAAAPVPPPWRGRTGITVLVRGAAIGAPVAFGLGVALLALEQRHPMARLLGWPVYALMFLPAVLLAWRHLLRPSGLGLAAAFGLRPEPGGGRRVVLVTLIVLGVGAAADLVIGLGAQALRLGSHWTEWFSADLVWGSRVALAVALVELLILAPLFEELVFRGLLHGTLRRRLGGPGAALLSAAVFAVGHGYGLAGLASVFTAGILYAWAYEQTGSLLPSMAAHAIGNLFAALAVIGLLRA